MIFITQQQYDQAKEYIRTLQTKLNVIDVPIRQPTNPARMNLTSLRFCRIEGGWQCVTPFQLVSQFLAGQIWGDGRILAQHQN